MDWQTWEQLNALISDSIITDNLVWPHSLQVSATGVTWHWLCEDLGSPLAEMVISMGALDCVERNLDLVEFGSLGRSDEFEDMQEYCCHLRFTEAFKRRYLRLVASVDLDVELVAALRFPPAMFPTHKPSFTVQFSAHVYTGAGVLAAE